jgi:hypothetical protein
MAHQNGSEGKTLTHGFPLGHDESIGTAPVDAVACPSLSASGDRSACRCVGGPVAPQDEEDHGQQNDDCHDECGRVPLHPVYESLLTALLGDAPVDHFA